MTSPHTTPMVQRVTWEQALLNTSRVLGVCPTRWWPAIFAIAGFKLSEICNMSEKELKLLNRYVSWYTSHRRDGYVKMYRRGIAPRSDVYRREMNNGFST